MNIQGLEWLTTHQVDNGGGSSITPFPTTHLCHLVFHGERPFSHGQYGYHAGLEDHLTFLGSANQTARGYFIDCRDGSPTRHVRETFTFSPSTKKTLRIPCGVAHCFDGLEGVYTLNCFRAYLPPPDVLLTDKSPWSTGADIYNFPMQIKDGDLPVVSPNIYPASERFYQLLSAMQKETLGSIQHEYPVTENITFPDGTTSTLMVRKKANPLQQVPDWAPIDEIDGLGWRRHHTVWSGADAGYSALVDYSPFQVIDHGESHYSTDAYGIHLEWEDRLTFVGPSAQQAVIKFIDCRKGSPTLGKESTHIFSPSPLRYLVVPPGVAHAFSGLENIFTINRPQRRSGSLDSLEPGNDVIDWPLAKRPAPEFIITSREEFGWEFYHELATAQRRYLEAPSQLSSASVLMVDDGTGNQVRVAIRSPVPVT